MKSNMILIILMKVIKLSILNSVLIESISILIICFIGISGIIYSELQYYCKKKFIYIQFRFHSWKIFKYDLLYQRSFARKNIILFFFNLFLHAESSSAVSWFQKHNACISSLFSPRFFERIYVRCFIDCRHSRTPGNPGFVVASIVFLVYP